MIKYVYSILWIQILSYIFMFYTDIFMFSTDISSDPSEVNKHYQCRAVQLIVCVWDGGGGAEVPTIPIEHCQQFICEQNGLDCGAAPGTHHINTLSTSSAIQRIERRAVDSVGSPGLRSKIRHVSNVWQCSKRRVQYMEDGRDILAWNNGNRDPK